eukprot:gene9462-biopygen19731
MKTLAAPPCTVVGWSQGSSNPQHGSNEIRNKMIRCPAAGPLPRCWPAVPLLARPAAPGGRCVCCTSHLRPARSERKGRGEGRAPSTPHKQPVYVRPGLVCADPTSPWGPEQPRRTAVGATTQIIPGGIVLLFQPN